MANISKIQIGATQYDIVDASSGYSQIEIERLVNSGIALGTITLNGTSYIIYAPDQSNIGGLEAEVVGNTLNLVNN